MNYNAVAKLIALARQLWRILGLDARLTES